MRTADFHYDLPADLIASHPVARGRSRLMVVDASGDDRHRRFDELPLVLRSGDLVVLNNTRVLPARLLGHKRESGGRVEILLVERLSGKTWKTLLRPAKRVSIGTVLEFANGLEGTVVSQPESGRAQVEFDRPLDETLLDAVGVMPLPPYIDRAPDADDRHSYQTVYASRPGAVAAPTAGLHFSNEILERLRRQDIDIVELTLHVGPGTFRPVTADDTVDHVMDEERYRVDEAVARAIEQAKSQQQRIVAVGTTVVRALESAALAVEGGLRSGDQRTDLFIVPGFHFRIVDVLLTNFHLPSSTLLMLVSAFGGRERILATYDEAIRCAYRFYSYGDAMLVELAESAPPSR